MPAPPGTSNSGSKLGLAALCILASVAGVAAVLLAEEEARWLIYALLGLGGLLVFLMAARKDALLVAVFMLGLQIGVYLRLGYGRAGSTEGIAIPFIALAGIALLLWRFLAYGSAHFRDYRFDGLARTPLLAILVTSFFSMLMSTEHFIGFAQLIFELELLLVYWLTYNLVRNQTQLRRVISLLVLMLVIQSLVLYVQDALGINFSLVGEVTERGEVPRPGGTVSTNPAGYASFITPPLMLCFAYFFARGQHWRPRGAFIAGLFGLAAMGLTFTRAAWAGTALGLGVIVFLLRRRRLLRWDRFTIVAMLIVLGAVALIPTMSERLARDYGANPQTSAWDERWGLMQIAFNVIAHHPITGVGPGAYNYAYKAYIPSGLNQWTSAVHNEFLLRAAETGLLGCAAFIAFIVAGFRICARLMSSPQAEVRIAGIGWTAGLVSLVWQMSWVPWTGFTYNAMLWFSLAVMDAAYQSDRTCRAQAASLNPAPTP